MLRCRRCSLAPSENGPTLNPETSLCSICSILEEHKETVAGLGTSDALLRERFRNIRGQGRYDCLAGLSGGKDSSYVVYRLKAHYGVRVLAYTWDNGFLTDFARANIERIVEEFQVDHVWVKPDRQVVQAAYKRSMADEGWPCSACFHFAEATAWRLAYEERIPFIVGGRTPDQILRAPASADIFRDGEFIAASLSPYDPDTVKRLAAKNLSRFQDLRNWLVPDAGLWPLAEKDVYLPADHPGPDDFAPEMINLFLYEPYEEKKVIEFLEKETNWKAAKQVEPLGHDDCSAHDAAGYLYYRRFGTPFVSFEVASQVRLGKLDRAEGEKMIEDAAAECRKYPHESMQSLGEMVDMSPLALRLLPARQKARGWAVGLVKGILGRS